MKMESAPMPRPIKKVEKMLDRRRIVFHIFEDTVEAYGQTAGGGGRVGEPEKLGQRLLSIEEMGLDRKLSHGIFRPNKT